MRKEKDPETDPDLPKNMRILQIQIRFLIRICNPHTVFG
jgi:hypothetical protein